MALDLQQQAAVNTASKQALVIAGAGSGKTRVLVERIAYLLEEKHVSAFDIICWTFTRKAAGEMRERLEKRIGKDAYKLTIGTMHAIALKQIHRFGEAIGLRNSRAVTVYSEWESDFMLKSICQDLGVYNGKTWKIPRKTIYAAFANYYERGVEPDSDDTIYRLFKIFISRCRENNAITYGSLLIGMRNLIPIMARYDSFKYVLVDECQDLDPLQWSIIDDMSKAFGASVFAVGDMDQSIYEFRGAVPKHLLSLQGRYDIYRLETNYRSDANIVEGANRLIKHNIDRIDKTMMPTKKALNQIAPLWDMTSDEIAWYCMENPLSIPLGISAVLARNHFLLEAIDRALTERKIPHTYVGQKTKLTNSEAFRRFHAFLKLLVNPLDNFSFLLIQDLIGVGAERYARLRVSATVNSESHFQTWMDSAGGDDAPYVSFFQNHHTTNLGSSAFSIRFSSNGAAPFKGPGWGMNNGLDIGLAFEFVMAWLADNPSGTIDEYLDWLATYDVQDELPEGPSDELQIMTIHAAKGLEWDSVMLAGVNEGILPSKKADDLAELESERRLMYVAMTRARDMLLLSVRPELQVNEFTGKEYYNPKSRFIAEITGPLS